MTARRRSTAIVIGAGIGGLAAAAALRRSGLDVEVYERASRLAPAGSALSLPINAQVALRSAGIELDLGQPYDELHFLTERGRMIRTIPFRHLGERLGGRNVAVHRAELQRALLAQAGDTPVALGAVATGFHRDGAGVRVEFADGRQARGDVVIGADGFHSAVRRQLAGPEQPREAGYVCWLATLPFRHPVVTPGYVAHYWGRGQRLGLIDLGGGQVYWWGTLNMPPAAARTWAGGKDAIVRAYAGWAPEVEAVIAATPEESIISVPAHDRPFLPRWGDGPVTLLGDAAHPMLPSLAQGAAMAIEDAVVLAQRLAGATDLPAALRRYEADRQDRTRRIVAGARSLSRIEQLANPAARRARDLYIRWMPTALVDRRNLMAMTYPGAVRGGPAVSEREHSDR